MFGRRVPLPGEKEINPFGPGECSPPLCDDPVSAAHLCPEGHDETRQCLDEKQDQGIG